MTIVEFFDKTAIENVAGALLCAPEAVVFVGGSRRKMERSAQYYRRALLCRGIKTEFSFCTVNKNNLQNIYTTLEKIVMEHGDCTFDLTGGEDLYLVAVGMLLAAYPERVNCHRFNFQNNTVLDCDANGEVCSVESFSISVEENVRIHGGEIIRDKEDALATFDWDWSNDFLADVDAMWEICSRDPRKWNTQIHTLGRIGESFEMPDALGMRFDPALTASILRGRGTAPSVIPSFLAELEQQGLISDLSVEDESIAFTFKNEQVKRCLTVAGQILEIRIASRILGLTERDGQRFYNDCRVGVSIDWDGEENRDEKFRTVNEIDVLAMRGAIPIFISCKNGDFDTEELYKLSTVADRFGGRYAKKVLVAADMDKLGAKGEYLRARAADMGIRLLDNVAELDNTELDRLLRSLWLN